MNVMEIFQTNWLDFLTWTLAGCMGIALLVSLVERIMPANVVEKAKDIASWPDQLRKAS